MKKQQWLKKNQIYFGFTLFTKSSYIRNEDFRSFLHSSVTLRVLPTEFWNGVDGRAVVESHNPNIGKLRECNFFFGKKKYFQKFQISWKKCFFPFFRFLQIFGFFTFIDFFFWGGGLWIFWGFFQFLLHFFVVEVFEVFEILDFFWIFFGYQRIGP